MKRSVLFILLVSPVLFSCYSEEIIRRSVDPVDHTEQKITLYRDHGIFTYTEKQNSKETYSLTFCYECPIGNTRKTISVYDSSGNLSEKISYGFPTMPGVPMDSLSSINRYPITDKDKEILKRIADLEKKDSFSLRWPLNDSTWDPGKVTYFYKLSHYRYDYTKEYVLFRDTIYNYDRYEYEQEGKEVYRNTIGYFREPEIQFTMTLSKHKSDKVIKRENKTIKEGKYLLPNR